MNIVLATLWKSNYQKLADVTVPNKLKYTKKWGYLDHMCRVEDSSNIMFVKLEVILAAMKKIKDGGWVWFTDCDSVVTNMRKNVGELIQDSTDSHGIIVANDFNGINSGSMLVRKDKRTIDFLAWMLAQSGRLNCEQACMQEVVDKPSYWNGIIKIVKQKDLNSYDYSMPSIAMCGKVTPVVLEEGQWTEGDLLIHFPATNLETRLDLCKKYSLEALDGH